MYIFLLVLLGLFLRLINIDKSEGLWNDEYVSWFIASVPFLKGFWGEVLKQCHMPLYYLYLKPFVGFNDTVLRLTSVIPSLLSIPTMFLIGKFFSKKTGYICASITAILPFLIYYSQEVRFYSLLFFFSALLLYYILKIIYKDKGWLGFTISSILILFTHVLGGIYIGLSTCYILYKKKKISLKAIALGLCLTLTILPFGINIIKMLPSSQWWGNFTYTNILFLFSDYFSPILTNNINAPTTFFYNKSVILNLIMVLPTTIAILAIFNGIKKAKGLFLIFLLTILLLTILAITGKIVFITKYSIEILPILILIFALGINNKTWYILLSIFIFFQLLLINTPLYTTKSFHLEGHKLVGDILNQTKSDKTIFTYYEPNRFYRYLNNTENMYYISKINRFEYLSNPEKILKNIKKGETVAVIFLDSVSFIPEEYIEQAKFKKLPEMFISFSIIRNTLEKELLKNYENIKHHKNGSWVIITGQKLK